MRLLIIVCTILFMAVYVSAETIKLGWDQEISDDFKGWELYRAPTPMTSAGCKTEGVLSSVIEYTGQTDYTTDYVVTGAEGSILYFRVCAVDENDNKTDCSNEVSYTIPDLPPATPYNLTIQVLP